MDNLELAKKTIRLEDIIPGEKNKKGKIIWVKECPICGHFDHLAIYPDQNKFHSFSGCCSGGSSVDWLIQYGNIESKTAIKELLSMAGLTSTPVSNSEISKRKKEAEKLAIEKIKKETVIKKCYNKLTNLERVLRELNPEDFFLKELLNFIDNYTMKFTTTTSTEELYHFCISFQGELLEFCKRTEGYHGYCRV